ncbi:MAG: hypothetical protein AB1730_02925 [Myxococcota bacterium]|jgi:hypothetical protein
MMLWDQWKQGFDAWENRTAALMETMLKSESVLMPMGAMLSASMKMKAATDKAVAEMWARLGLPTRRDQERTLHALNQIQSRLIDLEEKLDAMEKSRS